MSELINLIGKKFNHLTVIERAENAPHGISRWVCECECGNRTIVRGSNLKSGAVKSCGCLSHIPYNKTHGESKSRLYRKWKSMLSRCECEKDKAYKNYGARGIHVCEEWHDFLTFKNWVLQTRTCENDTLERIDVNKGYSPDNCTWIPLSQQAKNRTSAVIINYNGETHSLMEWCELLNLNYKNVHNRIYKLHWSFEKAINTPIDISKRNKVGRMKNG